MEIGPILRTMKRNKARFALIGAEVALTLAIVTNCVGLVLDLRREMLHPSGFDDEHLIHVDTSNFSPAFEDEEHARAVVRRDLEALRSMPGVRAATETWFLPWQGGGSSTEVTVAGRDMEKVRTQYYFADPQILDTLGVEVVEGRGLTDEDYAADPDGTVFNVVISRGLAELLFPDGAAVGEALSDGGEDLYDVVGVFDPFYNPYGWPIHEQAAFFAQPSGSTHGVEYLVRAEPGQTAAVAGDVERRLLALDDGRNLEVETVLEVKDDYLADERVVLSALYLVMGLLVAVTALGIVGLTAFSVTERWRTLGTRRALGATRGDVVAYFLLENWLVTTLGLAAGAALAFGLNVGLVHLVDGARLPVAVVAAGMVLLWTVGLAAALGPALRGARVAPAVATRNV